MDSKLALAAIIVIGLFIFGCTGTPDRGTSKIVGPADAKVSFVIYSDFQCPACGAAEPTVTQLMGEYQGKVRFVFKHFPLPMHANAEKAAEASECALDQGKFWQMHDKMFENQGALAVPDLKGYALSLGMNSTQFGQCLDSGKKAGIVQADVQDGIAAGVRATPTFFINGNKIEGGVPIAQFRQVIGQQLAG